MVYIVDQYDELMDNLRDNTVQKLEVRDLQLVESMMLDTPLQYRRLKMDEFLDAVKSCHRLTSVAIETGYKLILKLMEGFVEIDHITEYHIYLSKAEDVTDVFKLVNSEKHISSLLFDCQHVETDRVSLNISNGLKSNFNLEKFGIRTTHYGEFISLALELMLHDEIVDLSIEVHDSVRTLVDLVRHKRTLRSLTVRGLIAYSALRGRHDDQNVQQIVNLKLEDKRAVTRGDSDYFRETKTLRSFEWISPSGFGQGTLYEIIKIILENDSIVSLGLVNVSVYEPEYNWSGHVAPFLRSNKTLERLHLEETTINYRDYRNVLSVLGVDSGTPHPNLKSLELISNTVNPDDPQQTKTLTPEILLQLSKLPNLEYFTVGNHTSEEDQTMVIDLYRTTLMEVDVCISHMEYGVEEYPDDVELKNYLVEINRILGHLFKGDFSIINKPLASPKLRKEISDFQMPLIVRRVPLELQMELLKEYLLQLKQE